MPYFRSLNTFSLRILSFSDNAVQFTLPQIKMVKSNDSQEQIMSKMN